MSFRPFKTVVIDDEADIRATLVNKLNQSGHWEVIGEAESVTDAVKLIANNELDAVFLDIKIREGDAFKVLTLLEGINIDIPPIILNTGYAQFDYAQKVVNDYSDEVLMLLKKPFWENWDEKELEIITKLKNGNSDKKNDVELANGKLVIRVGRVTHFLEPKDILFVEVESPNSSKTKICINDEVLIVNKSLKNIAEVLPPNYVQISRQSYVNVNEVRLFDHEESVLYLNGAGKRSFHVGPVYRKNILF
jgi:two-component system LytT family response regulator